MLFLLSLAACFSRDHVFFITPADEHQFEVGTTIHVAAQIEGAHLALPVDYGAMEDGAPIAEELLTFDEISRLLTFDVVATEGTHEVRVWAARGSEATTRVFARSFVYEGTAPADTSANDTDTGDTQAEETGDPETGDTTPKETGETKPEETGGSEETGTVGETATEPTDTSTAG